MSRLTKKSGIDYIPRHQYRDYNAVLNDIELEQAYCQAVNKLGPLEDIEEELGCSLLVAVKAFKVIKKLKLIKIDDLLELSNKLITPEEFEAVDEALRND